MLVLIKNLTKELNQNFIQLEVALKIYQYLKIEIKLGMKLERLNQKDQLLYKNPE